MQPRKCIVCGDEYAPNSSSQKLCSDTCRYKINSRRRPPAEISHTVLGSVAELTVAADLMATGWHVFRALALHSFCDLIAVKDGVTRYIEVRTAKESFTGQISFPKRCGTGATEFAVFVRSTGDIRYFSILQTQADRDNGLRATVLASA